MLKLYLVRHGESAWNVKQLYTGQTDVPLSELGEMQAERAAGRLRGVEFQAVYASPLKRAQDTAKPIAAAHKLPLVLDERLAEIHHGAWEGNPAAVIREQYADEYHAWRTQPHRAQMPDGESLQDVSRRVQSFLQDLLAAHAEGNVLIVSHDAVLRLIVLRTLAMGPEYFWRWRFDNASVSILEQSDMAWVGTDWEGLEPESIPPAGGFRLAMLNDVHHLEGVYTNSEGHAL
jgi:alpha-ribazole phosphatase